MRTTITCRSDAKIGPCGAFNTPHGIFFKGDDKMQIVTRKKKDLVFYDTETVDFKPTIPLLIDAENNVLVGNSVRNNFLSNEDISCIVMDASEYDAESLYLLENCVARENNPERYMDINYNLKQYIANESDKSENLSFFDLKVTDRITPENYIKPPPFAYVKGRKEVEEDNSPTLLDFEEEDQ